MTMTNSEWLKMVEEKEEEILEKLEALYLQAAHNHDENFGSFAAENCLILDDDGELHIVRETPNTIDGRVWAGKAMYIAKLKDFHLFENEDEEEWIRNELEDGYANFKRYLQKNCGHLTLNELKKYDPKAYRNILDDMAWQVENINAPDWAHESYQKATLFLSEEM